VIRGGSASTRSGRCPAGSRPYRCRASAAIRVEQRDLGFQRVRLGVEHEPAVGLVRREAALPDLGQRAVAPVGQPEDHPAPEHGADLAEQRGPVGGDDRAQPDRAALAEHLEQALDQPSHVVLTEGGDVPLPPVEQQEHPRKPLRARGCRPLLGEPGEPLRGEHLLAARDLVAELAEQPLHPVGLLPGHHGAAVRELAHRLQGAGAAVDPVDVHVGG
jgi:hypothetical protein